MVNHVIGIVRKVVVMAIVISVILLFLGMGVLVLIHVCVVGRTLRRGLSDTNMVNTVERGSLGSTSMSQDDIEKLPCFNFKAKEKGTSPPPDCAVCLENFSVGEKCRLLPSCNHSFHADCLDSWLLRTPVCPICRAGADPMESGSLYGDEENGGFSGIGIELSDGQIMEISTGSEIVGMQGGEIENGDGNSAGVEVGLSQTVEVGDSSGISYPENQTRGMFDSSERVIEVRESQEIKIDVGEVD